MLQKNANESVPIGIRQIESKKAAKNFSVETFYRISVVLGVPMDLLAKK